MQERLQASHDDWASVLHAATSFEQLCQSRVSTSDCGCRAAARETCDSGSSGGRRCRHLEILSSGITCTGNTGGHCPNCERMLRHSHACIALHAYKHAYTQGPACLHVL